MPRLRGGSRTLPPVKVDVTVTDTVDIWENDCAGCGAWTPGPDPSQIAEFVRSKYRSHNLPPPGANLEMRPGFNWVPTGWNNFRMGNDSETRVLCPECSQAVGQALSSRRGK